LPLTKEQSTNVRYWGGGAGEHQAQKVLKGKGPSNEKPRQTELPKQASMRVDLKKQNAMRSKKKARKMRKRNAQSQSKKKGASEESLWFESGLCTLKRASGRGDKRTSKSPNRKGPTSVTLKGAALRRDGKRAGK